MSYATGRCRCSLSGTLADSLRAAAPPCGIPRRRSPPPTLPPGCSRPGSRRPPAHDRSGQSHPGVDPRAQARSHQRARRAPLPRVVSAGMGAGSLRGRPDTRPRRAARRGISAKPTRASSTSPCKRAVRGSSQISKSPAQRHEHARARHRVSCPDEVLVRDHLAPDDQDEQSDDQAPSRRGCRRRRSRVSRTPPARSDLGRARPGRPLPTQPARRDSVPRRRSPAAPDRRRR